MMHSFNTLLQMVRLFESYLLGKLDRLETAFNRQRQFTADASHELRTPLTIVNLEVNHALTAPYHSQEEYRLALGIIQAENEYMSRLVNNLLVLARADAGQVID